MSKATFVYGEDWEGVYIDGKLLEDGHSINPRDLLSNLGYQIESFDVNQQWLEDNGLPKHLENVVRA